MIINLHGDVSHGISDVFIVSSEAFGGVVGGWLLMYFTWKCQMYFTQEFQMYFARKCQCPFGQMGGLYWTLREIWLMLIEVDYG